MQGFSSLSEDSGRADNNENNERQQARALALVLRSWREAIGLTRLELAQRAGLQEGYVSRLERGFYHCPALAVMQKLAEALGQPIEKLYHAAGLPYTPPPRAERDSAFPELSHYLSQVQDLPYDDRAIIEKVLRGIFSQEVSSPELKPDK